MKTVFLKNLDRLLGRLLASWLPRPAGNKPPCPRSVLLIRPGGIGDAALLVPALIQLKAGCADISIDILAESRNAQIFRLCPELRQVYRYDRSVELCKVLRQRYDVVIDTEQWHRLSSVVARLIRSSQKIGFATNERRRMFTEAVDYSQDDYELESFMHLLEPLAGVSRRDVVLPFLHIPSTIKSSTDLLPHLTAPYVVLFPGASIDERKWGSDRFAELARRLLSAGFKVIVVGGSEDVGPAVEIGSMTPGVINLVGATSLLETASVLSGAALLISTDSGVLHIGVGLGIPTVSLFGPGIARKWAPRGPEHRVVNLELPCSPCTRFGTTPPCPIGARCIQDISVDRVFREAMDLLPAFARGD